MRTPPPMFPEPAFVVPTPRRRFVQQFAAAAAAIGLPWSGAAALAEVDAGPISDAWTTRIKGKHRMVFDATSANDGFAAAFAANYLDGFKANLNVGDNDITPVVVFRHFAMPLTLQDELWAKYHIGEALKIDDPATKKPATRNPFKDSVFGHQGMTYDTLMKRGVVVVACNLALTVISGMTAGMAGVTADQAKSEWTAGLLPGVSLAPSGVYAVARAQERGCAYCYAG